jgi:elongation factor P
MLAFNELKQGTYIIIDGEPYEILEAKHSKMGRGQAVIQSKIKNLASGKVFSRTFHQSDSFKEANLMKIDAKYLYSHRGEYWFHELNNPSKRFSLKEEKLEQEAQFLKPNLELEALTLDGEIISIHLPVKVDLEVTESPPGVKGDTAQGGTKTITVETGAKINVPLFINQGDVIRVNTQTGQYTERISKQ